MKQITLIAGKDGTFDFSDRPLPKVSKRFVQAEVDDAVVAEWSEARAAWDEAQRRMAALFHAASEKAKAE